MDAEDTERTPEVAPPTDNLVRGIFPGELELRESEDAGMPTMTVGFARYGEWTEIDSVFEGRFMERIAPGAFKKTIQENMSRMRALFQHGRDPQIGNKVLGPITEISDTEHGPVAEVQLLDTAYNRDLIPGLRAGVYGSSFNFQVVKEDFVRNTEKSDYNPAGLPERTITEAKVREFGPVTFPAYDGATAGVRSLTDEFVYDHSTREHEPEPVMQTEPITTTTLDVMTVETTSTTANVEPPHSDEPSRDTPTGDDREPAKENEMETVSEMQARLAEVKNELQEIAAENRGQLLDGDTQAAWDSLTQERADIEARIAADEARTAYVNEMIEKGNVDTEERTNTPAYVTHRPGRVSTPDDPFDMSSYHGRARSTDDLMQSYTDGATRALEDFHYPHPNAEKGTVNTHIERLLHEDSNDKVIARRILACGSPAYRRAFWKHLGGEPLTREEQAAWAHAAMELRTEALAVGAIGTGGAAVPVQLDPTLIPTSNGALNPLRQISRIVNTTSYVWQAVTTPGVTAQYRAEAAGMSNNAGTLYQPVIYPERADVFIPFSYELGMDWGALESELSSNIQDAKDALEATKFALGAGHSSNEPQGIITGAGTIVATSNGTSGTQFSQGDVYGLEAALPPRYIGNARWVSSIGVYQKVSQFDVGASAGGGALYWRNLGQGQPDTLLGYPAHRISTIGTSIAGGLVAGANWGVFGDFSRFVIVDRVGMSIRVIPDLFGGTAAVHWPTGQSGLVGFWRNSSGVVDSNAFRQGTISKGVN